MTTPTNWPIPDLPGVPMFPEKRGWHMLDRDIWEWCPTRQAWNDTVLHTNFVKAKNMAWRKYHGPVLTPAQIAEMLAGERERICLMIERNLDASCSLLPPAGKTLLKAAAEDITDAIRNLGAAP